jgi:uncharacterized protein involved in outer membrane biogenesis
MPLMMSERAHRWMRRLRPVVTGIPFLVSVAVVVVLAAAYTLAGFFLAPRLITTHAPRYVQEQLKRRLEIGEVRVNPLLFKLEIKGFRLQEADGRPLLSFDRLFVDFELSSLVRRIWTFAEIQLEAPRLDVVMTPDGRLNLADLLDAFPKSEPAPQPAPSTPPRVVLRHARMSAGVLSFTDLSGRTPQTATVQPIDIELRNIATLAGRRGPYAISAALIGGGVIDWEGEVSLVPLASSGHLGLREFPLATAWRFVQDRVGLAEPGGRLEAEARYQFAYRDAKTSLQVDGVNVTLADLALAARGDKAPLLTLERMRVAGARGDLITRELTVPEVSVSRGRLAAIMVRNGVLNWALVTAPPPASPAAAAAPAPPVSPPAATPAAPPWRLALDKVHVEQIAFSFVDQSRAAPLKVDIADVAIDLAAKLATAPAGLAGVVEGLDVKLARVTVAQAAGRQARVLSLDRIGLQDGRIDLDARQASVSRFAVAGGATTVTRAADGSIPLVTMLAPADQGSARASAPARATAPARAPAPTAPAAKPWAVAVAKLDLADHRVAIVDRSVTPNLQLELTGIKVNARELRSDGKKPVPFDAALGITPGGRVTARGLVAPDGTRAEATVNLARLALTPAQGYVASHADVELRSGEASTAGKLTYRAGRARPTLTYTGSVDVTDVNVVEANTAEPVVSWKTLHVDTLRFGLAPDRVEIDEVRLAGLDGKLTIFKDKSVSVAKLMKPGGRPQEAAPAAGAPTPAVTPPATGAPAPAGATPAPAADGAAPDFPVAIERLRVEDGSLSFADLSLVLPFAARVHGLNGVVVGVGTDPGSRSSVKLDGRVDEFGQVKVEGALSAIQPKVFTDIGVIFRNVPMSTLTPYSATFAGRRIVAGTMDLDLQYKIDRSALVGENKVVLTKLKLGERVESAGAMRLPLDLAIAILSDSQGRIDIALPVKGNVDSPQFSYGHLIWQALVTVITKIATSPFRALAGLVGGEADAERLQSIAFEPGSDVVQPPERERLQRVVEVLGKRTQLKVTVHGGYEAKMDGEALRSRRVRQELAQRVGVNVKPGEDPGPVAFDQVKTQRELETLLTERGGPKALEEFQAGHEKTAGKKIDRANRVLALVGRGSGDRAFYEALFRKLVEMTPLPESEVTALGQRRGEATARVLKERAGEAAARVEVGDTRAAGRTERNAVPTRLELGAAGS